MDVMTRSLWSVIVGAIFVSACAGPIETRIETRLGTALPSDKSFSLAEMPADSSAAHDAARQLVSTALGKMGFTASQQATILVDVALADRPAAIAITAGKDKTTIASAKARKPLQSCEDREHRINIAMFSLPEGTPIYTGSAAEFHCRGTMSQSLPHLVEGALSGLSGPVSDAKQSRSRERTGIE